KPLSIVTPTFSLRNLLMPGGDRVHHLVTVGQILAAISTGCERVPGGRQTCLIAPCLSGTSILA
ncbi:MAG: hypothetical protein KAS81_10015, partial [Anaerolineales bacterium]|nr:hypothetical protein [Anaerolineales bacterium]